MDANKKIDLDNPLCPNERKILANILQNHPLRFSIAASSSVPWIYLGQFWHTLKTIFQLPQATDNNHEHFVVAPKFTEMVPFYINDLGFTLELISPSNFKTTGLVQPWQTLCKMFSRCLTTRVTSFDQPPLQIMQMLYCFDNNIHVDYADLLWEGLHYSLEHPSTLIPCHRFTKLTVSHYMTAFPEISRRARDKYHNLEDDMMVKNIFNSGKHKDGVDVPTTQSQPIESTQGTHRTTSAPRSPNPNVDERESIDFKSRDELEAKQNVQKFEEHLIAEDIEKLVKGAENAKNAEVDIITLR
ncbi:hypothetical protein Tco_0248247 [Tanacetum coccineum]